MRRGFRMAFAACTVAATVPLLVTGTLPMSDLPEHMAQVAIWKHYDDPCHRFRDVFELNLATPYLLGYVLARALAAFVSVAAAVKATVWLAIVLLPWSIRALLARTAADPWWSLLGFPLAFGYSFYWGFFNFSLAVPLGIFYLALLLDERPRMLRLTLLALLLLGTHALMLVFCAICTVGIAAFRRSWRLLLPIAPALILLLLWAQRVSDAERVVRSAPAWRIDTTRLLELPTLLISNSWNLEGFAVAAVIAIAIVVTRPALTREPVRWALAVTAALVYFLAPREAFGSVSLSGRFAVLVVVTMLTLFEPRRHLGVSRALVLALVLGWTAILTVRFHRFSADARDFDRIVGALPANQRVILLNGWLWSDHVPGPVFWHFPALYQARKGGLVAESFANHYPQLIRYRKGAALTAHYLETRAGAVDWPGLLEYDYIVFRAPNARRRLFAGAPVPVTLRAQSGMWWAYETPRARTSGRRCEPLE